MCPHTQPVVLVPLTNRKIRLCIDYRGLNATTVTDSYPLPRMDDLQKHRLWQLYICNLVTTKWMFVFWTKIKEHSPDNLKRFVIFEYLCPENIALSTCQKLIHKFGSSLKDILIPSYLDDIIILTDLNKFQGYNQMSRNYRCLRSPTSNVALEQLYFYGEALAY